MLVNKIISSSLYSCFAGSSIMVEIYVSEIFGTNLNLLEKRNKGEVMNDEGPHHPMNH
jgi:hypothetical protein